MKELIIIGARGFGREVYSLAKQSVGYNENFIIKGFLDSKSDALDGFDGYPPILGSVEDYKILENDVFICALGSVKWKKYYVDMILLRKASFINLIHKSVIFRANVKIGLGCIVCEHCILSNDVFIDSFVTLHPYSNLGHDTFVGKYVHMGAYCFTGGFSEIKEEATLYVRSTILAKIMIGSRAIVGAGSLVIRNVKEGVTVVGNPARILEF